MTDPNQHEDAYSIVGEAVLRDYPLRLWAMQAQHTDEVMREFRLLLAGERSGTTDSVPARLVGLAQLFSDRFGPLLDEMTSVRQVRWEAGDDRMDWHVPLPAGTPTLMRQIDSVWLAVDEYCRHGELLTLARPRDVVDMQAWTTAELTAQFEGAEPTPWPGPF